MEKDPSPTAENRQDDIDDRPEKRVKLSSDARDARDTRDTGGVATIKAEYLIASPPVRHYATEGDDQQEEKGKKPKGQNTNRTFGNSRDALRLCPTRKFRPEFSPKECRHGAKCKFEHDLRKYLKDGKRSNLAASHFPCPNYEEYGWCHAGWTCRYLDSHMEEREQEDGRKELLLKKNEKLYSRPVDDEDEGKPHGTVNSVTPDQKQELRRRKMKTPKADAYLKHLEKGHGNGVPIEETAEAAENEDDLDNRAAYKETPLRPSEKRRLYYGTDTPVLAPLTTQGNLPFRRMCVDLGAQLTWSEMAMSLPLLQGDNGEWALMKAHESEMQSPSLKSQPSTLSGYNSAQDLRFGVQIAGNKPWVAVKATEVVTTLCPQVRAVDLNCGCPIDLVFRQGAGSALLDSGGKLEKILRGMNQVSGDVPITVKIRTGTSSKTDTAHKLIERLALGGEDARMSGDGPAGVAAITLHGRSRQQRYTKLANWEYISECAALIKRLNEKQDSLADTVNEIDARDLTSSNNGNIYFLGNGDCYSHEDYYTHIRDAKVDSVMIGRGALIKPWIFEEIEKGQYIDKSATERLALVEKFAKYGLQAWGSDEIGVGNTRRFLLEWLSFACRYIPIGILEHLPPHMNDRPPAYKGRSDLETLLASDSHKDWIKITEMFLGPCHPDFRFEPKHKSNSYNIEAEG